MIFNASFRITLWFRVGSYLKAKNGLFFKLIYAAVYLIYKHQQWLTGIQMPIGTKVGKGLVFAHFSNIVIGGGCEIGEYFTVFQGVTVGSFRDKKGGTPKIGSRVIVFAGAKIIGNVHIGNDVVVGANAVVTKNIPDNAVVAGVPAKIISYKGAEINRNYYKI